MLPVTITMMCNKINLSLLQIIVTVTGKIFSKFCDINRVRYVANFGLISVS